MATNKMLKGKAAELRISAELIRHGLDVYAPLVDVRAIDLIVRAQAANNKTCYWEIQVKSVGGYNRVIGVNHEVVNATPTYILIVNYNFGDRNEFMYLLQKQVLQHISQSLPSVRSAQSQNVYQFCCIF